MTEPRLLSITEAAREIGRSRWFVDQLIADGLLVARRRGPRGRRYVTRASLEAWIEGGAPRPSRPEGVYVIPGVIRVRGRVA